MYNRIQILNTSLSTLQIFFTLFYEQFLGGYEQRSKLSYDFRLNSKVPNVLSLLLKNYIYSGIFTLSICKIEPGCHGIVIIDTNSGTWHLDLKNRLFLFTSPISTLFKSQILIQINSQGVLSQPGTNRSKIDFCARYWPEIHFI